MPELRTYSLLHCFSQKLQFWSSEQIPCTESLSGVGAEVLTLQSAWSNALSDTSWATAAAKAFIIAVPEHCDVAPTEATAKKGSFRSALPDSPSQAFAIPLQANGELHSCALVRNLPGVHLCHSMLGHTGPQPNLFSITQNLSLQCYQGSRPKRSHRQTERSFNMPRLIHMLL